MKKTQWYEGRTALITSASSAIGQAFAAALARRGMHLILADIAPERLPSWNQRKDQMPPARPQLRAERLLVLPFGVGLWGRKLLDQTPQRPETESNSSRVIIVVG